MSDDARLIVVRTVWLAGLCLGGLSVNGRYQGWANTASPNRAASPEQTTVGKTSSQDRLTKADRLVIAYVHLPVPPQSQSYWLRMRLTKLCDNPLRPTASPIVGSRHRHEAHAKKSSIMSHGRRTKGQAPKKSRNVDRAGARAKAAFDVKACRRREGLAGMLRVLNLSSRYET